MAELTHTFPGWCLPGEVMLPYWLRQIPADSFSMPAIPAVPLHDLQNPEEGLGAWTECHPIRSPSGPLSIFDELGLCCPTLIHNCSFCVTIRRKQFFCSLQSFTTQRPVGLLIYRDKDANKSCFYLYLASNIYLGLKCFHQDIFRKVKETAHCVLKGWCWLQRWPNKSYLRFKGS